MACVGVIEDDLWMADCYRQWLEAAGYEVWHARDAQSGLDKMDSQIPDAILLDLHLPHANAAQFLHTLRSYAEWASVPVILCSSSIPRNLPALESYGVKRVVEKSTLSPQSLKNWISEVLHETV